MSRKLIRRIIIDVYEDGTSDMKSEEFYAGDCSEITREIKETEWKGGCLIFSSKSNIGKAMPLNKTFNVNVNGSKYDKKSHRKIKGRVDGFTAIFREHDIKIGDTIRCSFDCDNNTLHINKINEVGGE